MLELVLDVTESHTEDEVRLELGRDGVTRLYSAGTLRPRCCFGKGEPWTPPPPVARARGEKRDESTSAALILTTIDRAAASGLSETCGVFLCPWIIQIFPFRPIRGLEASAFLLTFPFQPRIPPSPPAPVSRAVFAGKANGRHRRITRKPKPKPTRARVAMRYPRPYRTRTIQSFCRTCRPSSGIEHLGVQSDQHGRKVLPVPKFVT